MIRTLHMTQFASAQVWVDEKRTPGFVADDVLSTLVPPSTGVSSGDGIVTVGVEAFVPRGARAEYGLLAVMFAPDARNIIQVDVPYLTRDGARWPDSLARVVDDVRLGLPTEYASAVLAALSSAAREQLPPGLLTVAEAAHGAVGSSERMFGRLAGAVVELAARTPLDVTDERLVARMRTILVE